MQRVRTICNILEGFINCKTLYKCELLSLLSFVLLLSPFVFPAFFLFTHASYGDRRKHISKKRRESNNIKWLPGDLGNGFNRLDLFSSPGWPFPNWDPGPTTCYLTAWDKQWHNLVVLPHRRDGIVIIHFGQQPVVQKEIMSDRKGKSFQHSIPS